MMSDANVLELLNTRKLSEKNVYIAHITKWTTYKLKVFYFDESVKVNTKEIG